MRLCLTVLALTALAGSACSKKDDGPPKMTKEALDLLQKNSSGAAPPPNDGTPVASRDNAQALPGIGLPPEAAARSLAVEAPVTLMPGTEGVEVNQKAAYTLGDDIRFEVRVSGFTLHEGTADFDFDWSITDAGLQKVVFDHKRIQKVFKPDGAYVAIITHHPVALGGGTYTIHAKVTDNLASYLSREATSSFSYGAPSMKPAADHFEIRAFKLGPVVAGQKMSFDFVLVGLLVDATQSITANVEVTLHPTEPAGPDRVLSPQKLVGKATADGAFPVTIGLDAVPAGSYQVHIHALDNATKRIADDTQTVVVK